MKQLTTTGVDAAYLLHQQRTERLDGLCRAFRTQASTQDSFNFDF
jgi:hypothetical protein